MNSRGSRVRLMTWYHRYQQMRVPRPGTLTLMSRGSLKRKSSVQVSDLGSSLDLTSRSLNVTGPWAGDSDSGRVEAARASTTAATGHLQVLYTVITDSSFRTDGQRRDGRRGRRAWVAAADYHYR